MIYNYVSIKTVIAGIYRDFDHQEELDVWDIVEWAAEALDLIGATQQFLEMLAELEVKNYKTPLPMGFKALKQLAYNGVPMLPTTGTMIPALDTNEGTNYLKNTSVSEETFSLLQPSNTVLPEGYYIQNGCIYVPFQTGTIVISYNSIPLDADGFPKIPDEARYIRAIKEYCQMMLDRKSWRAQRIPEAIYRDTESKWLSFMKQARTSANMPDISKMENIKNQWLQLKPKINHFGQFFNTLNSSETRKLH